MESVTIIVGTFGSDGWREQGERTAAGHGGVAVHGHSLAHARNEGAWNATTEWLCFLDADDFLSDGYMAAMATSAADLRAPALHLVYPDSVEIPDLTGRDITTINPCCIGTLIRRAMFFDVGGFWDEPAWEDWSLFRRCWLAGATIGHVADAVYVAHINPNGRNSTISDGKQLHRAIIRSHVAWLHGRAAA